MIHAFVISTRPSLAAAFDRHDLFSTDDEEELISASPDTERLNQLVTELLNRESNSLVNGAPPALAMCTRLLPAWDPEFCSLPHV